MGDLDASVREVTAQAMDIGQRIREVREDLGMPGAVLARRVGVAKNTIWRIERGERTPSVALIEKIAHELRTEPSELLKEPALPLDKASETGRTIHRRVADSAPVADSVRTRLEEVRRIVRLLDAGEITADDADKAIEHAYTVAA